LSHAGGGSAEAVDVVCIVIKTEAYPQDVAARICDDAGACEAFLPTSGVWGRKGEEAGARLAEFSVDQAGVAERRLAKALD
jgi:hypothetical protein